MSRSYDSIEGDIAKARDDLATTLDEIIDRVNPKNLATEGKERATTALKDPRVLAVLAFVGMLAMLWVGGHILLSGLDTLGVHAPEELVHHLSGPAHRVPGVGGALAWLVDTACSLVFGLVIGAIPLAAVHLIRSRRGGH